MLLLTKTDPVNGVLQVAPFETDDLAAMTLFYDMQMESPGIQTVFAGTIKLTGDTTTKAA